MSSVLLNQLNQAEDEQYALRRQIMGYIVSQTILAVTEAGVIDRLQDGPRDLLDLARETGSDSDALRRMLQLLAAEELVTIDPIDQVSLRPRGELLLEGAVGSLRHLCSLMAHEAYLTWVDVGHSLRTGRSTFEHRNGQSYFDWLAGQPEAAARFHAAQAGLVRGRLEPLLRQSWKAGEVVVDLGAGDGDLLMTLRNDRPDITAIAFDLPEVVERARTRSDLAAGITWVPGSFFDPLPAADTYILTQILHDWDDRDAVRILRRCREQMAPEHRLFVVEQVIPDDLMPHPARLLDLHMLVLLGGRERTEAQWRALFGQADLRLARITHGPRSALLEARVAVS